MSDRNDMLKSLIFFSIIMLLIKKDITKVQLRRELGIVPGTMSRLNKGEEVAMSVLLRICEYLNCDIGDGCEFIRN